MTDTVVVAGLLADPVVEVVCAQLTAASRPYVLLELSDLQEASGLSFTVRGNRVDGHLTVNGRRVPLESVRSVFVRLADFRSRRIEQSLAPALTPADVELVKGERQAALIRLLDCIPCLVLNRPGSSISNHSKLFQQRIARVHGFRTPRTLVTTDPARVLGLLEECADGVIVKSLSGIRSKVRRVTRDDAGRLEQVRNCPTQFQELIAGVDVRVHVVGERVFAAEIRCDATDYRYAHEEGAPFSVRPTELGMETEAACVALTRSLGLALSGVDLRRTLHGEYTCFEVNPAPAFLMYERLTGQPISEAVAEMLAEPGAAQ